MLTIHRKEVREIESDIVTLESQIPQALRGKGLFSAERLSNLLEESELKKVEYEKRLESKLQEYESTSITNKDIQALSEIVINWSQEFAEASVHLKKILLSKIIERIEIKKEEIRIVFRISDEAFHQEEGLREEEGNIEGASAKKGASEKTSERGASTYSDTSLFPWSTNQPKVIYNEIIIPVSINAHNHLKKQLRH